MPASLDAVKRDTRGKNEARRLRVAGKIPAVIYGGAGGAESVAVDPKLLTRILQGSGVNTIIGLNVEGAGTTQVLVKEFLVDPVHNHMLHADFFRVQMDQAITVTVSVVVKGEPRGVKLQGGILELPHREVEIESLPGDIPESIEVDVSELMIGQSVRLRDVATDAKWTLLSDPEMLLAHVVAPKAEEPAPEAVAAAAPVAGSEPEVIKKGKPEKEEEKEK